MKLVIPWVCVFALLVGCFYLYSTTLEDEKLIAKLRVDDAELERLRTENQDVKQLKSEHDELARMRNEHEELLRLRGEAGPLRKQVKELGAELQIARAQNSAVMKQQQQSSDLATENKTLRSQFEKLTQDQARDHADKCIRNLRLIEGAKELWARDNQKPPGSFPTPADLTGYFPNNTFPVCPDGGTYSVNALGFAPTCSVLGHALPKP